MGNKVVLFVLLLSTFMLTPASFANEVTESFSQSNYEGSEVEESVLDTRNWYSWINLMPIVSYNLHVIGEVLVGTPGIQPQLTPVFSHDASTLALKLELVQLPGAWPQVVTWADVRYTKPGEPNNQNYRQVVIEYNNEVVAKMPVERVY